ncbi:MAG TPA: hypothetical protein VK439_03815 [Rubrivivax sp.]|nr:hypothetical protein [Rubrivivax sp.]
MSALKKATALREAVNHLSDDTLEQLITELAFSTRLEQCTLHLAWNEQRRRRRNTKRATGN